MTGNPPWASKAAEIDSPVRTRAATFCSCAGEGGVLLLLGQHLERAEDRQAGADEGEELLVEDDEGFELGFLALAGEAARLYRVDIVAGGREFRAQFLGGGGGLGLLLDVTAFIGEFDYEFCH